MALNQQQKKLQCDDAHRCLSRVTVMRYGVLCFDHLLQGLRRCCCGQGTVANRAVCSVVCAGGVVTMTGDVVVGEATSAIQW